VTPTGGDAARLAYHGTAASSVAPTDSVSPVSVPLTPLCKLPEITNYTRLAAVDRKYWCERGRITWDKMRMQTSEFTVNGTL